MSSTNPAWLDRLNDLLREPTKWLATHFYAIDAHVHLAALLSLLGTLGMVACMLFRPPPTLKARALAFAAALLLAGLPVWFFHRTYEQWWALRQEPKQAWAALQDFYFLMRYNNQWASLLTPPVRLQLMAASTAALMLLAMSMALRSPKGRTLRWLTLILSGLLAVTPARIMAQSHTHANASAQAFAAGKALFDAKCQTAGIKRFASVKGEAGIRLLGLRAEAPRSRYKDRDWPDAGIAEDRVGQAYIGAFLDFEFHDDGRHEGWSIAMFPGRVTMKGFQYVDVAQADGSYLRYRLAPNAASASTGALSTEAIPAEQAARYAVNHVRIDTPQDREHWVAGALVTVSDTRTGKVLGELRAFSHVPPSRHEDADINQRDWELARTCPAYKDIPGVMARMFAEQIVEPARN